MSPVKVEGIDGWRILVDEVALVVTLAVLNLVVDSFF